MLRALAVVALAAAWIALLARVYAFGQERFFTVDEWQYGHATWLVAEGQRPYVDFYEHHFPLSYVAHAPLLWPEGGFRERALRLRAAAFAWAALCSLVLVATSRRVTGDLPTALLCGALPLAPAFGLMSLVDYRADNLAACLLLSALALLEAGRRGGGSPLPAAAGACAALALLATQKAAYLGAIPLAVLLLADRAPGAGDDRPSFVRRPAALLAGGAAVGLAGLAAVAAWGVLGAGLELAVWQAIRHEAVYPEVSVAGFLLPTLAATPVSSAALALLAGAFLVTREGRFWLLALGGVLFGTSLVTARYPYNYVLPCMMVGLAAARGAGLLARRLPLERAGWGAARPLLLLAPLCAVPAQLAFVEGASTNEHQLRLLERVERWSGPEDAVIDSAGGALFRPHGSFHWYQGGAQREIFAEAFERTLVDDYRASRALFWIRDLRQRWLPAPVQAYFRDHYVRVDGDLFALGFRTPRTLDGRVSFDVDVVRAGAYHVFQSPRSAREETVSPVGRVAVDGRPLVGDRVHLDEGVHRVTVEPRSPAFLLTPLPPEAFAREIGERTHSPTFEYRRRARALAGEEAAR